MGATYDLFTEPGTTPVCSRAGCSETAAWRVNWRNPRIHSTDRVKIWAACEDHRAFLADYLRSRAFPVRVTGIDVDVDRLDDADEGQGADDDHVRNSDVPRRRTVDDRAVTERAVNEH